MSDPLNPASPPSQQDQQSRKLRISVSELFTLMGASAVLGGLALGGHMYLVGIGHGTRCATSAFTHAARDGAFDPRHVNPQVGQAMRRHYLRCMDEQSAGLGKLGL